ncbi:transposase [Poseidonibacter ostreae]|uniref:Transposase n=1 Tax=Poseidonibacter ostreae TaxID=2654171 RepID=A0A6L4WMU0_9BACT|nr:transposase [Poseidonibacter ostreae]KAB7880552.1 transposase [Poseidonibacter ostreae]KAB7881986.1 transposase [Poseidonibacter ostreae]KAB7885433.1 transposase [Poseidonibacter ostreae]
MKQRDEYIVDEKVHNPRAVNLVCDATFYGKRKDKLGTLVFKDVESKEILIWKHIQSEVVQDYRYLKEELIRLGYTIISVTLDGKRGLYKAFKDIPIQMCYFHQKKIVQRYITMKPKLEAGKELKKIVSRLTMTNQKSFTQKLDEWYEEYQVFLDEKTISNTTGKLHYTHPRVRAAYRSLKTNLPHLFTYKNYKNIAISNTTNALEGGVFSHMKNMISLHRGLSKSLKINLVDYYLVNYQKK